MDTPLSNVELEHLMQDLGERANIIESKDIKATDDIESIFKGKGHAIIFIQWPNQAIGHWVIMVRHHDVKNGSYSKGGQIYYFDSFGDKPHNKNIEKVVLKKYKELLYNDKKFQPESSNACGRYCLMVAALNKMGLPPKQIEDVLVKTFKKKGSLNDFVIKTIKK